MTLTREKKPPNRVTQKNHPKPDRAEYLVESVAASYLNAIERKKSGIVLVSRKLDPNTKKMVHEVLIVLQKNDDTNGHIYIGFPKGTMEILETFEQTAEREFHEETGIDVNEMKKKSKRITVLKFDKIQMFVYLLDDNVNKEELKLAPITSDEILLAFWKGIDLLEKMPTTTPNNKYKKSALTIKVLAELRKLIENNEL